MKSRLFVIACLARPCVLPGMALAQPASARLTILHTNDTHGHLLPFSYPSIVPAGSDLEQLKERRDIGGIARRAALAQRIRTEQKGRGIPVWFVDIGDFSDGTPFSTEYKGEADVAAMNAAGYDFGTFGNHEFNNPLAQLQKLLRLTKHPVLLANAVDRATKKPIGEAWRIEKVGGVRVGALRAGDARVRHLPGRQGRRRHPRRSRHGPERRRDAAHAGRHRDPAVSLRRRHRREAGRPRCRASTSSSAATPTRGCRLASSCGAATT